MIEVLAAAALTLSAPQQAAPRRTEVGAWSLIDEGDACVLMREFRMQGRPYWVWIDSDARAASLRILSPQWRPTPGQPVPYRLSLNGQPVADQMIGAPGPEGLGGYAVSAAPASLIGVLAGVNTIRIDEANGGLLWGGAVTGLADGAAALARCVEGLAPRT